MMEANCVNSDTNRGGLDIAKTVAALGMVLELHGMTSRGSSGDELLDAGCTPYHIYSMLLSPEPSRAQRRERGLLPLLLE